MQLTSENIGSIRQLYGEDRDGAERALELLKNKRGVLKIFNEDGSVNVSKEELEKKLNKPSKVKLPKDGHDDRLEDILHLMKEVVGSIRMLKDLSGYYLIKNEITNIEKALLKRKDDLLEDEIRRIDIEIDNLERRKDKLLSDKNNETK